MKIDLGYIGAIVARNRAKMPSVYEIKNPLAGKQLEVIRNGQAYKLTISDEIKQVQGMMAMTVEEFFQKDINVQNADPSDIFSYRPQDQWLVFSQYLHESKYFDSLSNEEVKKVESILQHITDGMDSLVKNSGINLFAIKKEQPNSYEAHLELASSTAALQHFSDTFLSGDVKTGFDQLIQDYVRHNTKKVMDYQSVEEIFYAARAKINPLNAPLTYQQARHLSMTNKLGKTIYTHEEIESVIKNYQEMFKEIKNEEDLSSVLLKAKEQLLEFVTKGISPKDADYQLARDFVTQRSDDTFKRIENYWKMIWQGKQELHSAFRR
ncbi:hypothetical protein GT94_17180 [Geobacillus stearothermophilus]|uniref:hypothetical protein n=1 Tax=Parageobacillus toebii TaxID=153151 RepID=UPI0005047CD0|nr:hypothetical protein [Parageobacillus toebii]KFL15542.1 hypothetical protein ET31_11630 [Geobacillus stearothermophilus]KFX31910.1 hypothetical protein GT94_17180 [Geobacillus stearothermophilus]QSB47720.1 hypothetical protein JTI59_11080 [Parageobacillus toebii]WMT18497.1 hypothetical protein RFB12_14645 [Parageobacillus toebii]